MIKNRMSMILPSVARLQYIYQINWNAIFVIFGDGKGKNAKKMMGPFDIYGLLLIRKRRSTSKCLTH